MRTVEKKAVIHDRDYITSVTCDRCGKEQWRPYLHRTNPKWWENGGLSDAGMVTASCFGDNSPHSNHEWDICDDCMTKLIAWFRKAQNTERQPE